MSTSVSPVSHTNPLEPTSPCSMSEGGLWASLVQGGEGSVQPTLRWTGREGCLCPHTARAGSSRVSVRDPSKTLTLANASAGYGGQWGNLKGHHVKATGAAQPASGLSSPRHVKHRIFSKNHSDSCTLKW